MPPIKKLNRNIEKYEMYELFSSIAEKHNIKTLDKNNKKQIVDIIKDLYDSINTPILMHGKQTEKMFSFVASCLYKCILIKQEDAGFIFSNDNIKIPDFRLLLQDKKQLLIEVKNHYAKSKIKTFQIPTIELQELNNYSRLMQVELKIAIFWSNMGVWTLVDTDKFTNKGNKSYINFETAMKNNEMSILGDCMLATTPPLEMRLYVKEKELSPNCINGIINEVEFYANKKLITDKQEENIALNLMLFGDWKDELYVKSNGSSRYVVSVINPIEITPEKPFNGIGFISSIISKKFKYFATDEKSLTPIYSKINPESLFLNIDIDNYHGKTLHLWRFVVTNEL